MNKKSFSFEDYAPSLSDNLIAESIYSEIQKLDPLHNQITIDFAGLIAMTTVCAKNIFGKLYIELGAAIFNKNMILKNAEESIRIVMKWGITKAIEENSKSTF